jgi:hypothetical protein
LDGAGVNHGAPRFHLREDGFAKTEHRKHVYSISFLELLIGNVLKLVVTPLKGGIVHQDIDAAESIDRFLGNLLGYRSFADIARNKNRLTASFGDQTFRLLGILVFRKVGDSDIRSLSSKSEGYRPAYAAISSGDQRMETLELTRALVGRLSMGLLPDSTP